ncbi:P-loop containing nucleoside triphosphate hydrolase protein, partial [Mycena leptocephala]
MLFVSSSNSFSLLPSKPKIFHGRESELKEIIETLTQDSPRVAILGGGGMGKTSLARTVLHHPNISSQFEHRFFVSSESATDSVELAALMGLHLGLDPGKDLTKAVVQYFARKPPSLLILDNLETTWEPLHTRGGVEELLSLLADIPHLALMITMRGAERPAKVAWTRPFLLPLSPLSDDAARKTFTDITDGSSDSEDVMRLLHFTNNMPLAVDLIAHLADYEGCANVLARWEIEKTSVLSSGNDRKSNLDTSIRVSLSSPRITSGAKELLSLLSILPDGFSDVELLQSHLPIQDIRSCKAVLLATSLVYVDDKKRLRSLMPIREHIQKFSPPPQFLIRPLQKHFHSL